MATHSRTLAWKIPCTEEPGGLQSVGSQRIRHDPGTERTHILSPDSTPSTPVIPMLTGQNHTLVLTNSASSAPAPQSSRWVWRKPLSCAGCFPLVSGAWFSHVSSHCLATTIHFPGPVTLQKAPSEFSYTFSSTLEPPIPHPLPPSHLLTCFPFHGDVSSNQRTSFRPLPCLGMLVFCLPSCQDRCTVPPPENHSPPLCSEDAASVIVPPLACIIALSFSPEIVSITVQTCQDLFCVKTNNSQPMQSCLLLQLPFYFSSPL